jgi:tRNA nucleotidyltransferase/poly(A) polymerase
MSDYMFNLESHLSPEQNQVLHALQGAAAEANVSLFLAGGAMRDMLGGFAIRDLDFVVEGNALKLARSLEKKSGAAITTIDELRKSADLVFPNGCRCELSMARQEKFTKPGARPQVTPATIHEDLRGRDFAINAIALSLNRASRGLMIDPANGVSDLERRELRCISNYSLYDDPIRLFRLIRFRARLGFTVVERTEQQYRNAIEANVQRHIQPRTLYAELRQIALESNPLEILKALEAEGLINLFSPALTGAKLNAPAFQKLAKIRGMIPFGTQLPVDWYALSMYCITQLLTPKEKSELIGNTKMAKAEIEPWQKLEARAKPLERALKSPKLSKASQVYSLLSRSPGELILLLHLKSGERIVQDRIRNFFAKHLPVAVEVTDAEVAEASGIAPDDPKFAKAREDRIAARLDGRVKKPPAPPPEPEPAPPPAGRGPILRGPRAR